MTTDMVTKSNCCDQKEYFFVLVPDRIAELDQKFVDQYIQSFFRFIASFLDQEDSLYNPIYYQEPELQRTKAKLRTLNSFRSLGYDVDYKNSKVVAKSTFLRFFSSSYHGTIVEASAYTKLLRKDKICIQMHNLINQISITLMTVFDSSLIDTIVHNRINFEDVFNFPILRQSCNSILNNCNLMVSV